MLMASIEVLGLRSDANVEISRQKTGSPITSSLCGDQELLTKIFFKFHVSTYDIDIQALVKLCDAHTPHALVFDIPSHDPEKAKPHLTLLILTYCKLQTAEPLTVSAVIFWTFKAL